MAQRTCVLRSEDLADCRFTHEARLRGLGPFPCETEEAGTRPVAAADLARDHRQRAPVPAFPFEPVLVDDHRVGFAPPFPHQLRARLEAGHAVPRHVAVPLQGLRQIDEAPPRGGPYAANGQLLDLPGHAEHEQVASHPLRRRCPIEAPPLVPERGIIHLLKRPELHRGRRRIRTVRTARFPAYGLGRPIVRRPRRGGTVATCHRFRRF